MNLGITMSHCIEFGLQNADESVNAAIEHFEMALTIYTNRDNHIDFGRTSLNLALAYQFHDEFAHSTAMQQKVLHLRRRALFSPGTSSLSFGRKSEVILASLYCIRPEVTLQACRNPSIHAKML